MGIARSICEARASTICAISTWPFPSAANVTKAYGDRVLFSGLTLNVAAGECIALIGANGSGKTTLLDILAGDISPDTGNLSKHRNVTIGYLKQESTLISGKTLIQEVLEESSEVTALRDRIATIHESLSSQTCSGNHGELLRQLSQLDMALEAADGGYVEGAREGTGAGAAARGTAQATRGAGRGWR